MRFSVYQVSRKGGRDNNEDRMGHCYTREAGLFVLADGMGGHPEGEVAAQLALQTLAAMFQRDAKPALDDPGRFLIEAIVAGHHRLLRYATEHAMIDTPRTTIVACVLQQGAAWWAHCGDSRLYLLRGHKLIARTRDHSYCEMQGSLTHVVPILGRPNRNVLFTCLGSPSRPVVDSNGPLRLQDGDRLMLCSDGLWATVDDAAIAEVLSSRPVADAVPELVELALREGGPRGDNVTVLAVEWESVDAPEARGGISTLDLAEEMFTSTILPAALGSHAGMTDDLDAELDDAEIERSIREINDAIRRSSAQQKKS